MGEKAQPEHLLRDWLAEHGYGELHEALAVKPLLNGTGLPLYSWWLVRVGERSLLVADGEAGHTLVADLSEMSPLTWTERMVGGELTIGPNVVGIPGGKAEAGRRFVGLARAAPRGTSPRSDIDGGRFIRRAADVEALYLGGLLDDDELVLAWIETATEVEVPSDTLAMKVPCHFLLTSFRQALVAISAVGDGVVRPLPQAAIDLERSVGRDTLHAGGVTWSAPLLLESTYEELVPLPALASAARVLEVARLGWVGSSRERDNAATLRLVEWLLAHDEPLGVLCARALADELGLETPDEEARDEALGLLLAREQTSGVLVRWWRGWRFDLSVPLELLSALLERGDEAVAWAVELHASVREELLAAAEDGFEEASVDIGYTEHLLAAGRNEEAQITLEARLEKLPDEELLDLLPPASADLAAGSGGQRFRIRLLELLASARGGEGALELDSVRALAQLQPLVPARVRALLGLAEGEVAAAARAALSVLEPGGLSPLDDAAPISPDKEVHAISKKLLRRELQHPATREGHSFDKLQTFLASVDVPDHAALRAYCERLSESEAAARGALADACVAFGMRGVGAFVSRGDRAVGIRAYEGDPPFLVIGGRHLEPGSDFYLHPWELRFVIGAEVAHLRFQHSRVTASEVWSGAVEKGRFGVDLVIGLVPMLKGVEVIEKIGRAIDRYAKGPVGRVMKGLDLAEKTVTKSRKGQRKKERPREEMVGATNDKLIAAHRVMQLTADCAGLLLAGDLGAAIRAIFRSSHEYLAELPVAERHGIAKALGQRDDAGDIRYQDLAVRVSSLISFFLSDEYRDLRAALTDVE